MDLHGFPQSPWRWHDAASRILPRKNLQYRFSALDDIRAAVVAVREAGGLSALIPRFERYAGIRQRLSVVFTDLVRDPRISGNMYSPSPRSALSA